ncbi:DNA mismatch repair protein MutT [Halobacillus andaensis]|uniref:DNA mismatch repair protein MutT n=1 Tax=Halobacillus andaensis TaxID=1176239 RepID=A0A917EUG2_HALAA|nr:NUDIX hydrolase [Halobacillus andaensis]MBP2004926.1 8-oxo-dGTP pyrophosphatase MutT (NUDIX family) [Halobacillus andaensis]GGF17835.1 DNA mismatch repair protein MutT [Halobacillus andaensis]
MDIRFAIEDTRFNFRAAAVWIIDDHVLLHRQAHESHWALPGGGVEINESTPQTIVREMKEELGVKVKIDHLPWIVENFFTYNDSPYHEIGYYYQVSAIQEEELFQTKPFHGKEGERLVYQWIPIAHLGDINLRPSFLIEGLTSIPSYTKHRVEEETSMGTLNRADWYLKHIDIK